MTPVSWAITGSLLLIILYLVIALIGSFRAQDRIQAQTEKLCSTLKAARDVIEIQSRILDDQAEELTWLRQRLDLESTADAPAAPLRPVSNVDLVLAEKTRLNL